MCGYDLSHSDIHTMCVCMCVGVCVCVWNRKTNSCTSTLLESIFVLLERTDVYLSKSKTVCNFNASTMMVTLLKKTHQFYFYMLALHHSSEFYVPTKKSFRFSYFSVLYGVY